MRKSRSIGRSRRFVPDEVRDWALRQFSKTGAETTRARPQPMKVA